MSAPKQKPDSHVLTPGGVLAVYENEKEAQPVVQVLSVSRVASAGYEAHILHISDGNYFLSAVLAPQLRVLGAIQEFGLLTVREFQCDPSRGDPAVCLYRVDIGPVAPGQIGNPVQLVPPKEEKLKQRQQAKAQQTGSSRSFVSLSFVSPNCLFLFRERQETAAAAAARAEEER